MDFTWVKRKDCKVLLQDSTLVYFTLLWYWTIWHWFIVVLK